MGFEYRLEIESLDLADIQSFIEALPGIRPLPANESRFEYRASGQASSMPEAVLSPAEYGLYFCANSTEGKRYLGIVISALVSNFGSVAVSELA